MKIDRLFRVLVLEGALLTVGCVAEEVDEIEPGEPTRTATTDTSGSCPAECVADDYAISGENNPWECTVETTVCCWTSGECCDLCC